MHNLKICNKLILVAFGLIFLMSPICNADDLSSNSKNLPATNNKKAKTPLVKIANNQQAKTNSKDQISKISNNQSVVLGVIEGLTEYLPVSSTGHLIIASHAMGLSKNTGKSGLLGPEITKNPAIDSFEIIIQIGAILAVIGLYRKDVGNMLLGLAGKSAEGFKLFKLLLLAFMPAVFAGLLLHKTISEYLFSPYTVAGGLIAGGVAMILIERKFWTKRVNKTTDCTIYNIQYWQALVIGLAQCLAMWPGMSRSMVTILAGIILGLNFVTSARFSFLLALPTLSAATVYSLYKDWSHLVESAGIDTMIIGVLVSMVAAAFAVKAFATWLTKHGMIPFGFYRIALGIAVFIIFWS